MLSKKELKSLRLRKLFDDNGFSFFRMSKFEEYDFYADKKDFLPFKSILTFTDADGRLMALRPDVTLSLIKNAGEGKFHYCENVYRVPRNSSSFRELSQAGLEFIGNVHDDIIKEVLSLAVKSLSIIAEQRNYILAIADAHLILQALNDSYNHYMLQLLSQKNIHGLKEFHAPDNLIALAELNGDIADYSKTHSDILSRVSAQLPNEHAIIDFSVADNTAYYNGIVFKGFVDGIAEAVIRGGQYSIMNAQGIGFAVYLDLDERRQEDD